MKKQLFNALLFCLMAVPFGQLNAGVVDAGTSTEGKTFWVTFPRADESGGKSAKPFLAISAKKAGKDTIRIVNDSLGLDTTIYMTAADNRYKEVEIADKYCYLTDGDDANDHCFKSLYITATDTISLYAGNWPWKWDSGKKVCASFDVANILPDTTLRDEYIIQAYEPSDHDDGKPSEPEKPDTKCQGSHFAIIAAENDVVVDYCPTAITSEITKAKDAYAFSGGVGMTSEEIALAQFQIGDTLHTPVLKKGQVWYVWTDNGGRAEADLTGTWLQARDGKRIAVFNGVPHTNIPFRVRNRDQLFEQAMPTQYWGTKFAVTASEGRYKDRLAILALNDETEVHIKYELSDGTIKDSLAHSFNFATNPKRYWEFEYNTNGADFKFVSCYIETSCPCAVHQIMVSNAHDQDKDAPGDPSMAWLNPIEQVISDITFSTFQNYNHYVNIVTDSANTKYMHLLGMSSKADSLLDNTFKPLNGNPAYKYARIKLDNDPKAYTLTGKTGFIANVYGLGSKESYSYSVGGATNPLTQSITIKTKDTTYVFSPDQENNLCGKDTIHFACKPDFDFEKIVWHFGDGTPDVTVYDTITDVPHYYTGSQDYNAVCYIHRSSANLCKGQSAIYPIPITVRVGHYEFKIFDPDIPCPVNGVQGPGKIPYTSTINLKGNNVTVDFDAAAKAAGFTKNDLTITPNYFELKLSGTNAEPGVVYGITIEIDSDCGDTIATLPFELPIGNDVITQRYNNVLGLLDDSRFAGKTLSEFQWYRASDSTAIEGQISSNLNMYDLPGAVYSKDEFYVCYTINKGKSDEHRTCACAKGFDTSKKEHEFEANPDSLIVTANYDIKEDKIFVNANWGGKKDIECYAQWITASGNIYGDLKLNIPDGGCTIPTPNANGLYLLRVYTDGKNRSFKFIINK